MRSFSVTRSRNRSSDKNNKSVLPRISSGNRSTNRSGFLDQSNTADNSVLLENPFYIPPDEDILNYRDQQKETRASVRKQENNLKIWEKGPDRSMRHQLRKVLANSFAEEREQDEREEVERMNILEAAKSAIKNRLKNREPLKDFLAKKKEMFLFQLNINEKKEQIKEFEELAHLQDVSLQQSMHMLEKDATTFHKYVEESKTTAIHAVRRAEDELKEVQKLNNTINKHEEALSNSISRNARKVEQLERLYAFKIFLDKLTPEDFFKPENRLIDERPPSSGAFRARRYEDNDRITFDWEKYQIHMSPQLRAFLAKDLDQYKMYFQKQEQLQLIFETLEEKNLFIMRHIQELEQNIEMLKHNFGQKKQKINEHQSQLEKNKKDLQRTLQGKQKAIEHLKNVNNHSSSDAIHVRLEKALKQIYMNRRVLGEVKNEHEKDGFEMLKEIEKKLDSQTKEMDNFKPQKIMDLVKTYKQKRREEATLLKKEQEENEKKMKTIQNLKRLDTHKRTGRPIMARSHLKKEVKQEVVKDVLDPEEIDKQLYFTKRFN